MWQRSTCTPIYAFAESPRTSPASSSGGCSRRPVLILALFATYSYHGFIVDRDGDAARPAGMDHRRHAVIEPCDPTTSSHRVRRRTISATGRFDDNGSWLPVQVTGALR